MAVTNEAQAGLVQICDKLVSRPALLWIVLLMLLTSFPSAHCCPARCGCAEMDSHNVVICRHLGLTSFPKSDIPQDTTKIDFGGNNLDVITKSSFPLLPMLRNLSQDNCQIVTVTADAFANFPALEYLSLSNNKIHSIDVDAFRDLYHLQEIYLDGNGILSLPNNLFSGLNLQVLSLNNNSISYMDESMFTNSDINSLHLDGNNFRTVPRASLVPLSKSLRIVTLALNKQTLMINSDAFSGLNLTHLNLSHSHMSDYSFMGTVSAKSIDISGNRFEKPLDLTDFHNLREVEELYFRNLGITRLRGEMLSTLSGLLRLDLSFNIIPFLAPGVFQATPRLQRLDLSHNLIYVLPGGLGEFLSQLTDFRVSNCQLTSLRIEAFDGMTSLRSLHLDHNKLQVFPESLQSLFTSFAHLDLRLNPLHCNCEMRWFREWMEVTSLTTGADTCFTPRKKPLLKTDPDEFTCSHPRVYSITESQNVHEGEDVFLVCDGRSDPAPVLKWDSPSGETLSILPPPDRTQDVTSAVWLLENVQMDKGGWYKCSASNPTGYDIQFTYINVVTDGNGELDMDQLTYPTTPAIPTTTPTTQPTVTRTTSTTRKTTTTATTVPPTTTTPEPTTVLSTTSTPELTTVQPTTTTPEPTPVPPTTTTPELTTAPATTTTPEPTTAHKTTTTLKPTTTPPTTSIPEPTTVPQTTTTPEPTTTAPQTSTTLKPTTAPTTTALPKITTTTTTTTVQSATTEQPTPTAIKPTTLKTTNLDVTEPAATKIDPEASGEHSDPQPPTSPSPVEVYSKKKSGLESVVVVVIALVSVLVVLIPIILLVYYYYRYRRRHRRYQVARTSEQTFNNNVADMHLKNGTEKTSV